MLETLGGQDPNTNINIPDIKEDPGNDNTARPPGDWQVEPDPAEPPPADENGDPIPDAPENVPGPQTIV